MLSELCYKLYTCILIGDGEAMAEEFNIGDRVLYKDIGRKRDLKGTVSVIARDKKGKITGYTVKLDEHDDYLGSWLGCAPDELSRLKE